MQLKKINNCQFLQLRKVGQSNNRVSEFALTPYEMLMDDIRWARKKGKGWPKLSFSTFKGSALQAGPRGARSEEVSQRCDPRFYKVFTLLSKSSPRLASPLHLIC